MTQPEARETESEQTSNCCPSGPPAAAAPRRGRWYQFSLWALFALTLVAAVLLTGWRWMIAPYVAQADTMALIERLGGSYQSQPAPKWMSRLAGQDLGDATLVNLADCDQPDDYLADVARLPRLEILVVGGQAFGDEQIAPLSGTKSLRWLILDSTSVSADALAAVQDANPDLQVYRSQRRTIAEIRAVDTSEPRIDIQTNLNKGFPDVQRSVGDAFFEEVLWLNSTFVDIQPAKIARFPTLDYLFLYGVRVPNAEVRRFVGLPKLRSLGLREAQVTDQGIGYLAEMVGLHDLDLGGNDITDAGLVNLAGMTELVYLNLASNPLTDSGIQHLRRMKALRELSLDHTRIGDAALACLAELTTLDMLSLRGTRISDVGVTRLVSLNLTWLDLNGTEISDRALERIARMGGLKNIYLIKTRVTAEGGDRLQKALPRCKIESNAAVRGTR